MRLSCISPFYSPCVCRYRGASSSITRNLLSLPLAHRSRPNIAPGLAVGYPPPRTLLAPPLASRVPRTLVPSVLLAGGIPAGESSDGCASTTGPVSWGKQGPSKFWNDYPLVQISRIDGHRPLFRSLCPGTSEMFQGANCRNSHGWSCRLDSSS